jgi:hypothetical protein
LWGSIGWATPAAFGAAVAARDRRVVLVTGEGSHQLTAQEISQFGRRGLKPIVFVLNNVVAHQLDLILSGSPVAGPANALATGVADGLDRQWASAGR